MKVLLVEDDEGIARALADGLTSEGHAVEHAACIADARSAQPHDIMLLDLRLPDGDGIDYCREVRATSNVPIIMLSARGEEIDRVVGLEVGADDYLVKPFGLRELLARMRAVTRRAAPPESGEGGSDQHASWGAISVDAHRHTATANGEPLDLTPTEFALLQRLLVGGGGVVTRRELMRDVWGTDWYGPSKTIDMHMGNLRRKLGDADIIETVRGIGFRLVDAERQL